MMSTFGGDSGLSIIFLVSLSVVQRVDTVSEGIENYGGKIIAVETDLKKLGRSPVPEFKLSSVRY